MDLLYSEFWSTFYFNLDNEATNSVTKFVMTLNEEQEGNVLKDGIRSETKVKKTAILILEIKYICTTRL